MRFVWKCGIFYSILYNLIRVGLIWRDFIMRLDLCVGIFSSGSCFVFKTWCFIGVTFCTASCHFFVCLSLLPWNFEYIVLYHHSPWARSFVGLNQIILLFHFFSRWNALSGFDFLSAQTAVVGRIGAATNSYFHYRFILFYSFIVSVIKCKKKSTHLYFTQSKVMSLIFFFVQSTLFIYCHTWQSSRCLIIWLEERLKQFFNYQNSWQLIFFQSTYCCSSK